MRMTPTRLSFFLKCRISIERGAFAASADLRERMQESGVVDKPDIYFLNS